MHDGKWRYWAFYRWKTATIPEDFGTMGIEREAPLVTFEDVMQTQGAIVVNIAKQLQLPPDQVGVILLGWTELERSKLILPLH